MTKDAIVERVNSIRHRRVLNSHLRWITEYTIELETSEGHGSSPSGETRSIFERDGTVSPDRVVEDLITAVGGTQQEQPTFDDILAARLATWGNEVTYTLSTAFAEASGTWLERTTETYNPRLLVNLFNGSLHAYTNPVRSNLHEVLLVPPPGSGVDEQIDVARALLTGATAALRGLDMATVGGNQVHIPPGDVDHGTLSLTAGLIADSEAADGYRIMVDAAAAGWFADGEYVTPVTRETMSSRELSRFWHTLCEKWDIAYLEDPFAETDLDGWTDLQLRNDGDCLLVGDDLHSGGVERLERSADQIGAVIVKPDQCGTVTDTRRLVTRARELGLEVMLSHRSIETDSDALIRIAALTNAEFIKIGPLKGFDAVTKVNGILRANASVNGPPS